MEKITELIKQRRNDLEATSQTQSQMYLQSTTANKNFLVKYSVACRKKILENKDLAFADDSQNPKIHQVVEVYGYGLMLDWIKLQLAKTFSRCGFDFVGGSDDAMDMICETLTSKHKFFSVNEIMLFLSQFEAGDYGDFGRVFNSQKFFAAFRQFSQERQIEKGRIRDREEKEEKERRERERAKLHIEMQQKTFASKIEWYQEYEREAKKRGIW